MVTSIAPILEQQHMPRAQAHAGGQDAHVRFDLVAYVDSSTSITQLAKQTPDQSHVEDRNRAGEYCCNQQYSVAAITTSTGAISERYAYSAYGQPTMLDASGSVLNASSISNRYTYTGREWDATLGLHHFRARWMSPSAGRFLGRDPIGYRSMDVNLQRFVFNQPLVQVDPTGLECTLWILVAHGFKKTIEEGLNDPRFDPDFAECDMVAPVCCWVENAKRTCREHYKKYNRKCKMPNNWPKGNHCIDTSTKEGFDEVTSLWKKYIPDAMNQCCMRYGPCKCKECKVRYFCQDNMVGVPNAPLDPLIAWLGENPCEREYTFNCETKQWNPESTPWH